MLRLVTFVVAAAAVAAIIIVVRVAIAVCCSFLSVKVKEAA